MKGKNQILETSINQSPPEGHMDCFAAQPEQ
jgi:hypothetical protein